MTTPTLTIGILSWGAHKTLINTLESYREWGLDRLGDERLIFFQEISNYEKQLAGDYGYIPIGAPSNIGIAEGYKALVESTTSDLFLFLENDWLLIEEPTDPITVGKKMLEVGIADVIRYRHRRQPGNPLWTYQFLGREYDRPSHLLDAVHYHNDEELTQFPELETVEIGDSIWWRTNAKNANWTNNPTLFRTEFLRQHILPHMGSRDVELDLQSWWEQQDYLVAQGDGLFTHWRIG
jgi:hypothetical protein